MKAAYSLFLSSLLVLTVAASGNDGGIAFGGSPRLLTCHPCVRMASEKIEMTVGRKLVTVDCRFVFENKGPSSTVRMGFPDQGVGAYDPDEENANWKSSTPRPTFRSFKSWVNGKAVATKVIRADQPGKFWHTKTVTFPAHSQTIVRDLYTVPVGGGFVGQAAQRVIVGEQTSYVVHTGASWNGFIGRTEVVARFDRPGISEPIVIAKGEPARSLDSAPYTVYYTGLCEPVVEGKALRFIRTNWRPTQKDDLTLTFARAGSATHDR